MLVFRKEQKDVRFFISKLRIAVFYTETQIVVFR